ncbi:MAG: hypothetical protein F7B59_00925 [Desulfurococcales archaeon]|nr:hypothetical protein [Desulfurococcales archaeon]
MKVQIIHAKEFWFKSNKPATKIREPLLSIDEPLYNALVLFISIERNDKELIEEIKKSFLSDINKLVESLKPGTIVLYPYAHLSDELAPPSTAVSLMRELEVLVKETLRGKEIKMIRAPFGWYKEFYIHCYGHPLSELSRRYGGVSERRIPGRECYSLQKIIDSFDLKPVFKDVYRRWGYLDKTGVYLVQLNALTAKIQSLFGDRLKMVVTHSCDLNEILEEKIEPPALVVDANRRQLLFSNKDLNRVSTNLFEKPISINGDKLYLDNEVIGICKNSLCITHPLETVLAKRIYLAIKESMSTDKPPVLECWISPVNVYLATATSNVEEAVYSEKIASTLGKYNNVRIYIDVRRVRLGKKLRDAGQLWSNYVMIIGRNDLEKKTLTIRDRKEGIQFSVSLHELEAKLNELTDTCSSSLGFIEKITD